MAKTKTEAKAESIVKGISTSAHSRKRKVLPVRL